jgi:hypothetical protein
MKCSKNGLFAVTILLSLNCFAQVNEFNLSDYKLPDIDRRSLETNLNLYGNNSYYKRSFQPDYSYEKGKITQYNGDVNIFFNRFQNKQNYQRVSAYGGYIASNFNNRKEGSDYKSTNNQYSSQLMFRRDNRKYYNSSNFLETNLDLSYKFEKINMTHENAFNFKNDLQSHIITASFPLKIGKGRIEPVQDARQAVYIIDELVKEDRILPAKTGQDIIEFAKHISRLNNKRFFDSRLKRISDIESLDSFLVSNEYLLRADSRYFAILSDLWSYGNRPFRNSGNRFSAAIIPGGYYHSFKGDQIYNQTGEYDFTALYLNGGLEFLYEKPINLSWQHTIDINAFAGLFYGRINDITNSTEQEYNAPGIKLQYAQTIGYYPNTRTDMSFGYSLGYNQYLGNEDNQNETIKIGGRSANASGNLNINYYISQNFRLRFSSSMYYIWQEPDENYMIDFEIIEKGNDIVYSIENNIDGFGTYYLINSLQCNFRLSLIYSIF